MKSQTEAYISKEEAVKRQPAELYHFWRDGGEHWRYTSGDVQVTYGDPPFPYIPAALSRSTVKYDSTLEVTVMTINIGYLEDPVLEYIAINPVEIIWVSVMKILRDMDPLEASVVFLGQIKNVSFKGNVAAAQAVGFEHFLAMPIPLWRYQKTCNHKLFDVFCKVIKTGVGGYEVSAVIALDATKTILTSASFAGFWDGYFIGGSVEYGDEKRTIVAHAGQVVTLAYPMGTLINGATVSAFPGCDGRPETCRDKFDNTDNGLWFPFIPEDNPAIRTP